MSLGDVTIGDLFSTEPEEITDDQFERIILHYRQERDKFLTAEKQNKRAPAKKKITGIKIEDLEL